MSTKTTKPAVTAAGINQKETCLSANSIIKFRFHEDDLDVVRDGEKVWVSLTKACRNLGLAEQRQAAKLKAKGWATTTVMVGVGEDGKNREMLFLDLDSVPMWLATIELSRVAEEIRPKLERYQVECARVLRDYFFGRSIDRQYIADLSELKFRFKELESTVKGIDKATVADWAHKVRTRLTPKERRWLGGQMYKESLRAGMIPGRAIADDPKYTVRTYPIGILETHFARLLDVLRSKGKGLKQTVLSFPEAR